MLGLLSSPVCPTDASALGMVWQEQLGTARLRQLQDQVCVSISACRTLLSDEGRHVWLVA